MTASLEIAIKWRAGRPTVDDGDPAAPGRNPSICQT